MPSQVPSFSSFELPQTIEPEASTSKHDKKRRRHRPEEEEEPRRHRHRSTYDDRALDGERDSGRSHRRRNETESTDEKRRDSASRKGEREKRTSFNKEPSREDKDERHRSRHRREHAEHNAHRKAIDYRSRSTITSSLKEGSDNHPTSYPEVDESQHSKSLNRRGRDDSADDDLHMKRREIAEAPVYSLSLIKAVTQDWTAGTYDVRGDGSASRYGGPEASQIPRYKRAGKGAILGLPLHLRIVATTNSGVEVSNTRRRSSQASDAQAWHQTLRSAQRRITPAVGGPTFGGGQEDFVRLQTVTRRSPSSNLQMADPFQVAAGHVCEDDQHTSSSGSDMDDEEPRDGVEEAALKARLREVDQRTRSHPAEVKAWLALADLQQQVVGGDSYRQGQGSRERGSAARKTIAEVQLSLLDKGQRACSENAASIILGLTRLQVAISGSLWDDAKMEAEFRRLLESKWDRRTSDGLRQAQAVWAQYLSWKPTSSSATLSDVSDSYAEALKAIASFETANAIEFSFSLQLRLCELLQRAGYSARGFAILQAQIELTVIPFLSGEEATAALQRHWDCEEPRIGEQGAVLQAVEVSEKPTERARTPSPSTSRQGQRHRRGPLDQWIAAQKELSHLRQRPARTDDPPIFSAGEGEVDPFSVVLFSDIRPFLVSGLPGEKRLRALGNVAQYLGLEAIDGSTDLSHVTSYPELKRIDTQEWSARLWPSSLQTERQKETCPGKRDVEIEPIQQPMLSDPWACPLIRTTRPLNSLAFSRKKPSTTLATSDVKWLSLMLQQLPVPTDEQQGAIAALQLAIAAKTGDASILDDAVRKPADGDDRADLARARVFALDESPLSLSPELGLGVVDAVEFHIGLGQPDIALPILEKAVSNGHRYVSGDEALPVTVAQKLKARRYSNIRDDGDKDASQASVKALVSAAWYHYLVGPHERRLAAALDFFDGVVDSVPSDRTYRLCEARLRIVWYHLSQERPIYRPDDVRRVLIQSIRLFPHDLSFLALLAAHESRFRIEGVVRRTLEECVLQPLEQAADRRLLSLASLVEDQEGKGSLWLEQEAESSWLMAIYIELHLNREVVNSHLVRSLFERAVQQEVTKASNVLWTLYLSFEVRTASKTLADLQHEKQQGRERQDRDRHPDRGGAKPQARSVSLRTQQKLFNRAKGVFYRAVSACPFDRDIYLQAYEYPFRLAFSAEELRQLFSVMDDERELRVFGRIEGLLQMEEAERGGKGIGREAEDSEVDAETDDEDEEADVDQAHG